MNEKSLTPTFNNILAKFRKYIYGALAIGGIAVTLLYARFLFNVEAHVVSLMEDREILQSQISALVLSMDDRERLLALDRALMQIPAVRDNMKNDVPAITKKLVDTQNKYYSLGIRTSRILAIIEVESGFVPTATSKTQNGTPIAFGLMQIIPTTAKSLLAPMNLSWSPGLMYNPTLNIELGSQLFANIHSNMIERGYETTDSFNLSHAIYYMGERAVMSSYLDTGRVPETARDYVVRINLAQKKWATHGM